jgi:abortive infection bacteriophage resistance protein
VSGVAKQYRKPHLTYEKQVDKLIERGLEVPDREAAESILKSIGYYRLSGYLHTLRPIDPRGEAEHDVRLDRYVAGSTFQQAVDLWSFDRSLRLVLLDGLEQFEIAMRTALAYSAGQVDPFIHYTPELLDPAFTALRTPAGPEARSNYDSWLTKYLDRVDNAKNESFVKWFAHKYDGRLPIWVAIEILEFGQTSRLIHGLPLGLRREIASSFGLDTQKQFSSWIATLNGVRNVCAHHSRLWNRTLVTSASRPNPSQVPELEHLRQLDDVARVKVYAPIAILVWLLSQSDFGRQWTARLLGVLDSFPALPQGSLGNAGFPDGWRSLALWA